MRKDQRLTMVENRVMRKMFGPKMDEKTGEKTEYEDFYDLNKSPNIIRTIKSRKIKWSVMWHVWGRIEERQRVWWKNLKETTWKRWM
jgi:hypothetical protein